MAAISKTLLFAMLAIVAATFAAEEEARDKKEIVGLGLPGYYDGRVAAALPYAGYGYPGVGAYPGYGGYAGYPGYAGGVQGYAGGIQGYAGYPGYAGYRSGYGYPGYYGGYDRYHAGAATPYYGGYGAYY